MVEEIGYSVPAEQHVIGVALSWPEKIPHILASVSHSDFSPGYQRWIIAIEELSAEWKPIDAVTWLHRMAGQDAELNAQLRQAAVELADLVPTANNLDVHLTIIQDMTRWRTIRSLASKVLASPPTLDGMSELVEGMVSALRDEHKNDSLDMLGMWQLFETRHDVENPPKYARTGLSKLDGRVRIKENLYGILAGYPSDGKTALAIKFALNFAAQGYRVGFFSFETDHGSLIDRIAVTTTGIRNEVIAANTLTDSHWNTISSVMQKTGSMKIDWIEASGMTVHGIRDRSKARGYDVIFIDYLQLIASSSRGQKRYDAVTEISMSLHNMAQQTGITVIALSQFNRPDRYAGEFPPPPTMSMLRESGQIEQDADFILALYQDTLTDKEITAGCIVPDGRELRMLKVLKNKTGPRNGGFHLLFDGPTQQFTQLMPPRSDEPTYYKTTLTETDERVPFE